MVAKLETTMVASYVEGDRYYGEKTTMNVWEPKIQQSNEFILSQIWILGGYFGQDLNSIEAGWQWMRNTTGKEWLFAVKHIEGGK